MRIGEAFRVFCGSLVLANRDTISYRYRRITRALNEAFRSTSSETANSWLIGSIGRATAVGTISDVDMVYSLPWSLYSDFDDYPGNGQAILLRRVRDAIRETYPATDIGPDGRVVGVEFTDSMTIEVVPAFRFSDGRFTAPDSQQTEAGKRLTH
jgi:hypothetical protein